MTVTTIELTFSDREVVSFIADRSMSLMEAAAKNGVRLASDCLSGTCQTCKCEMASGKIAYEDEHEIALDDGERAAGAILPCQAKPLSDVIRLSMPYTRISQLPRRSRKLVITAIRRVSDSVFEVAGKCHGGRMFAFLPGQYVNLSVPGTDAVRSYSMMTPPEQEEVGFLIRALPNGAMSTYLSASAKAGDVLSITGPFGTFYRRRETGTCIMVAGGTGLAPMLSMLRERARRRDTDGPVVIAFGVNTDRDLFYRNELEALKAIFPGLRVLVAAMSHGDDWQDATGTAVDLVTSDLIGPPPTATAYLCGPPAMVEGARRKLLDMGMSREQIFAEEFQPTGAN
ncbi:2Fe-2S iron-sulfur cluster binding domain-containing protein [Xanthobacter sp. KR7-65]|uniref:2Fe-2S iron-sulfur cluster binding domain-containing protein n=1 Tax=Xanthobacter sp. KR7-65 TaxID=3156612 RepID=UPI0032B53A53